MIKQTEQSYCRSAVAKEVLNLVKFANYSVCTSCSCLLNSSLSWRKCKHKTHPCFSMVSERHRRLLELVEFKSGELLSF